MVLPITGARFWDLAPFANAVSDREVSWDNETKQATISRGTHDADAVRHTRAGVGSEGKASQDLGEGLLKVK